MKKTLSDSIAEITLNNVILYKWYDLESNCFCLLYGISSPIAYHKQNRGPLFIKSQ